MDLLQDSRRNKSTAFAEAEREALGLTGLLPDVVESEDMQLKRVLQQLGHKSSDIDRYVYLIGLLDHNETLFYRTLMSDPARFLPIVYDPTVGEACLKFGHIFRRPRGMYVSIKHKGRVKEILRNWPENDVRFICATSGERILGLGDLGANGMGIPIGKLQLYTACAGVPPQVLLPMVIDFGTNNESLLNDPLYLGIRAPRPSVAERDAFVEEFVAAVQEVFPRCCIHFEDWAGVDAVRLLARYRDKVCCYNDDIQGTAGAALVGIFSALRVTGGKMKDQRVLFLGAGSAGTGIAGMIVEAMMLEGSERGRGARAHRDVRRQRPHRVEPQGPARFPEALCAQICAEQGFRRRDRVDQADRDHRREHVGQGVRPARGRGDGQDQQAADHLCAVEPDRSCRVHRRGGLQLVRRPRAVRGRRSVRAGRLQGQGVRAGAGQQSLRLPGGGARRLCDAGQARARRAVHRRRARRGRAGHLRAAQLRSALSAAERHSRHRDACRGARRRGDLRARPRRRRQARRHDRLHRVAHVPAGIRANEKRSQRPRALPDRGRRARQCRGSGRAPVGRADPALASEFSDRRRALPLGPPGDPRARHSQEMRGAGERRARATAQGEGRSHRRRRRRR